jgi:polysaccharide pyruvyl transferase WcaK-like protein
VDLRVWEADASLDGVIALLRRLDMVICMRFHATIFACQQRRVIGIDYRGTGQGRRAARRLGPDRELLPN